MRNVVDMQIAGVDHVMGSTLHNGWRKPMTVVINTNGESFVDYGENYMQWVELIGEVATVEVERCDAEPTLLWVHANNKSGD